MAEEGNVFPGSDLLSQKLMEAFDFALKTVSEHNEPLIPFVWTDVEHYGFVGETFDEVLEMARAALPTVKHQKYRLVAYDGFLTLGKDRNDAIYIDAQDTGARFALRVAQRYAAQKNGKVERIGNPVFLGKIESFG